MAQGYAAELLNALDGGALPAAKIDGRVSNAPLRRFRATLDLSQATVKKVSGDTNVLVRLPAGYSFAFGVLTSSVTLATSTVSIGIAGTAAKYRASAVSTAVDTPAFFGKAGAIDDDPLTAYEDIIWTTGTADLPGTGIVTVDIFASGR